jgi:ABC-type amino acid transport substrate-binding protein
VAARSFQEWENAMEISLRDISRIAATLVCLLVGAGAAAGAEGELTGTLKKINDTGIVTIGYRESSLPFSYLSGKQPIGYSIDLCHEIVDDIGRAVGRSDLGIRYKPVTSESRIPAVVSGEVDLECGSTTANAERRKDVDFSPTIYVSATKLMVRRGSPVRSFRDLGGRTVAVTAGTTNEVAVRALIERLKIPAEIIVGRDHAESFGMVRDGRAVALALDDVLLYGLIAAAGPEGAQYVVLNDKLSYEPYGIMFRRGDPGLASLVADTFRRLAQTREIRWIYERWFLKRLPTGERLNIAMSEELAHEFELLGLEE